jgi:hypothetical protein
MRSFGKKYELAKPTATPRSGEEALGVALELRKKYPQMYNPGWGVAKAIKKSRSSSSAGGGRSDMAGSTQFRSQMARVSNDDYAAIMKMGNKKKTK